MAELQCPVCQSSAVEAVISRTAVPVHQNLLMTSAEKARAIARGNLGITVCTRCGFVFNSAFDLGLLSYGENYDNTQTCSPEFNRYVEDLVHLLADEKGLRNRTVVEVGCGKGHFLRMFIAYAGGSTSGVGFDPSYVGPASDLDGRLNFRTTYYDQSAASVPADGVICRHVIEHIPQPVALLKSVRQAVSARPNARVFFETPCIEWIFKNGVTWDLFYEHCSIFSRTSITTAFELAGFKLESVRHVFGGQYLWTEATPAIGAVSASYAPAETVRLAREFSRQEAEKTQRWKRQLESYSKSSRCAIWGAGAKGVTFLNLVDPECRLIRCVVDVNPNKSGKYLPGTGHKIVGPADLAAEGITRVLVLNPNYVSEIERTIAKAGLSIPVVDLMSVES